MNTEEKDEERRKQIDANIKMLSAIFGAKKEGPIKVYKKLEELTEQQNKKQKNV